jgi:hypothetical protein
VTRFTVSLVCDTANELSPEAARVPTSVTCAASSRWRTPMPG